jgi:arabinose-5-phosphate isomerase
MSLTDQDLVALAQQTLAIEAHAIEQLKNYIDADFVATIRHIAQLQGGARVVLSGIGKSAIIAQKIAATFNSTGTPALFMHAADAVHGDLGMIQAQDLVVVISYSGETPEIKLLVSLIAHAAGNILVAITGNKQSYLAKQARYVLCCAIEQEACPHNLAPTTSTTAQLAMGDALAVSVLQLRNFTASDFAKYHPGGALGKRLYLKVRDLCQPNQLPAVALHDDWRKVVFAISSHRLGATAVLDPQDQSVCGIITDGDLRRMLSAHEQDINHLKAIDLMTRNPKTIAPDELAATALQIIRQYKITQIIVVQDKAYMGMVHLHDIVREGII